MICKDSVVSPECIMLMGELVHSLLERSKKRGVAKLLRIQSDRICIHTGKYANARTRSQCTRSLRALEKGLIAGLELDLDVHAGHGITYRNVGPLASMPGFSEFNIGHSIISRAVFVGLRQAVREMKELLDKFCLG